MDSAISIRGLTKVFSGKVVVDKVSLEIPKGTVYGLIGPNGAGKTTTVRMLSTLIKPSAGTALVNGFDVVSEPGRVRSSIGVLPEDTGLYDRLTASETLAFYGGVQGLDGLELAKNIREAQQYLSPIFLVLFIPLYVSSFLPPSQLSQYAAIPVLGYSLLIRDIVVGTVTASEAAFSIGTNLIFLAVVVWLGLRLLNSEKIILRAA